MKNKVPDNVKGIIETRACKKYPAQIEDDEIKDDTFVNEVGGSIHEDKKIPFCRDFIEHMEDEVIDQFGKMEYKKLEDEMLKKNHVLTPNTSNLDQVGNVSGGLEYKETHYVINKDAPLEGTINDDTNQCENRDE